MFGAGKDLGGGGIYIPCVTTKNITNVKAALAHMVMLRSGAEDRYCAEFSSLMTSELWVAFSPWHEIKIPQWNGWGGVTFPHTPFLPHILKFKWVTEDEEQQCITGGCGKSQMKCKQPF